MKNQEVKKSMETKENESGRSMVEMLGVLAIMGVLAIGGVAGYRWAMDKYNANEILNEVRKRAVTASQQRILGHAINLSEYGNNTIQGHTVTSADHYDGDTNFFTITVEGIEQNICDKVLAGTIPFAIDTWVGDDAYECTEGNNDITFLFKNTLDPERPAEWETTLDPETTAAMTTEEIALTEMATASSSFNGSSEYTVSGSDGIWGTVTNSGYWPEESGTVMGSCGCGPGQICDMNNNCFTCDNVSGDHFSELEDKVTETCRQCDLGVDWVNCRPGSSDKAICHCASDSDDVGEPAECEGGNKTGFFTNAGACIPCSSPGSPGTTQDNCSFCNGQDGRDKRYYLNGSCYSCSYEYSDYVGTSGEGKAACLSCNGTNGTTKRYYMNGYCFKTCPDNTTTNETTQECVPNSGYFCNEGGYCYSCSDRDSAYIGYSAEGEAMCHSCNTGANKRYYSYGFCYKCPTSLSSSELNTKEKCEQCGGKWSGSACSS